MTIGPQQDLNGPYWGVGSAGNTTDLSGQWQHITIGGTPVGWETQYSNVTSTAYPISYDPLPLVARNYPGALFRIVVDHLVLRGISAYFAYQSDMDIEDYAHEQVYELVIRLQRDKEWMEIDLSTIAELVESGNPEGVYQYLDACAALLPDVVPAPQLGDNKETMALLAQMQLSQQQQMASMKMALRQQSFATRAGTSAGGLLSGLGNSTLAGTSAHSVTQSEPVSGSMFAKLLGTLTGKK